MEVETEIKNTLKLNNALLFVKRQDLPTGLHPAHEKTSTMHQQNINNAIVS